MIDLAVRGAALAEAIALSYKVRVAVAVETAQSFGTNESNMSPACGIKHAHRIQTPFVNTLNIE